MQIGQIGVQDFQFAVVPDLFNLQMELGVLMSVLSPKQTFTPLMSECRY